MLGDVLEQVVLHSQIEADSGASAWVVGATAQRLISTRRERSTRSWYAGIRTYLGQKWVRLPAAAVLDVWESVKAEERASAEDTV